ncbi:hypothetical protein [Natrinema versiforme]|uniref:Uncharacterized protein n=1 Tax=Natrinema versiforme JCM 10478 TaxID=1227496 RepID=L9Y5D9_9EURY|nr:hypothetical protein [Natrinema versiforme]ELY68937.1 hypothetical protein C489_06208 [Natrinema versiforme JCM 10478]
MSDTPSVTDLTTREWNAARKKPVEIEYAGPFTDPTIVETIEGDFEVDDEYIDKHGGFVIIRGIEDELYPCALDIFRDTYETLDEDEGED